MQKLFKMVRLRLSVLKGYKNKISKLNTAVDCNYNT